MRIVDERPSTLRDHLDTLRRRRLVVLIAVIVVPFTAVLLSLREPALYRASASVLLNTQNLAANLEGLDDPTQNDPTRLLRTQAELARLPEVARRTVQAAGLESWDAVRLLDASTVSARDDSDLLKFAVDDGDSRLAALLATEYARQYTLYRSALDTRALKVARTSVNRRIRELEADGAATSALYVSLVEKRNQLETLESLQTARAVLVRPANDADQVQPKPKQSAMLGVALGLLLGVGLAFLLEALDSRIRTSGAIVDRLGLRLLARIPEPQRRFRGKDKLAMLVDPDGAEAEAFRMLRASIELANSDDAARTIMITSAVEGEGKSTTVANLAIAFARAGRHVVLVDLDLRSASIHRLFRLPAGSGLTDVVLRATPLQDALAPVEVSAPRSLGDWNLRTPEGTLEILRAGTTPPNPGEFIAQLPVNPILEYLKSHSDLVLIDGPPLLRVGDAMALSSAVDALVVVARVNVVSAPMLENLDRILRDCPASLLGLVVTGAGPEPGYGSVAYPRERRETAV